MQVVAAIWNFWINLDQQGCTSVIVSSWAGMSSIRSIVLSSRGQRHPQFLIKLAIGLLSLVLLPMLLFGIGTPPVLAVDYNKEFLVGADLSNRDLTDASFTKANLRESNLSHANLRGVSFFGANLEGATLEGADLRNATLDTARLSRANLTNAILEGAFAFNAKFDGAIIDGADFTDVEVRGDAQKLLCKLAKGTNPVTKRQTRDTLNCP